MENFPEIKGQFNRRYNDDVILILFSCPYKRSGEIPSGCLAKILESLNLSAKNTYSDLKNKIWKFLKLHKPMYDISERQTILQRNIDNAGYIAILRRKEGDILLKALNLPLGSSKEELQKKLIEKILNKEIDSKENTNSKPGYRSREHRKVKKYTEVSLLIYDFLTRKNSYVPMREIVAYMRTKGRKSPAFFDWLSLLIDDGYVLEKKEGRRRLFRINSKKILKTTSSDAAFSIIKTPELGNTEDDECFKEGRKALRSHLCRERNRKLIAAAKAKEMEEKGVLRCLICKFIFKDKYGEIGADYIEAHHVKPVSELKENEKTKILDIALVCSNCHRMLHRRRPWLSMSELKKLIVK